MLRQFASIFSRITHASYLDFGLRDFMCLVGQLHLVRVTVPVLYPIMLPAGIDFHCDFQLPPFSSVVKSGEDESRNHIFFTTRVPKRTEVTFMRRFSMKTATPVAHHGIQHQRFRNRLKLQSQGFRSQKEVCGRISPAAERQRDTGLEIGIGRDLPGGRPP